MKINISETAAYMVMTALLIFISWFSWPLINPHALTKPIPCPVVRPKHRTPKAFQNVMNYVKTTVR